MARSMSISVYTSKNLQVAVTLLQGFPSALAKQTRRAIKELATPEWKEAVQTNVHTYSQQAVLANTAKVGVSGQTVTLTSATTGISKQSGVKFSEIARAEEFGAPQGQVATYESTSSRGRKFIVHGRHSTKQLPAQSRGWTVYPAAAEIIPRIASLLVQTVVRTFHETFEGGSK